MSEEQDNSPEETEEPQGSVLVSEPEAASEETVEPAPSEDTPTEDSDDVVVKRTADTTSALKRK